MQFAFYFRADLYICEKAWRIWKQALHAVIIDAEAAHRHYLTYHRTNEIYWNNLWIRYYFKS